MTISAAVLLRRGLVRLQQGDSDHQQRSGMRQRTAHAPSREFVRE
jgi:hypothetical protein